MIFDFKKPFDKPILIKSKEEFIDYFGYIMELKNNGIVFTYKTNRVFFNYETKNFIKILDTE